MLGMSDGQVVFVIVNMADVMVAVLKEDCCGSKVVGGGARLTMKLRGNRSSPRIWSSVSGSMKMLAKGVAV